MHGPVRSHGAGPVAMIQGPGWGPSSDYLHLTLAPLLSGWRVLTYDPRNTGGAPRDPHTGSQSAANLAADLEAVRLAEDLDRFVLLGHSHGAFIALAYAIRYPTAVRALVLIAPGLVEPGRGQPQPALLESYQQDPERAEAVALLRDGRPAADDLGSDRDLARWMRRRMPANFHDLDAMRAFQRQLVGAPAPSLDAFRGIPQAGEEWVRRQLGEIRVPTLAIVGRQDVTTPPAEAAEIVSAIPGACLVVLESAGHNPWVERPEEFGRVVGRFLGRVPRSDHG